MRKAIGRVVRAAIGVVALPIAVTLGRAGRRGDTLVWGPVPILNNSYWSEAMRAAGRRSLTLVTTHYAINRREDFDLEFDDLVPRVVPPGPLRRALGPYAALWFLLRHSSILHLPFSGGPLGATPFWRLEAPILRRAGLKTVVLPFGADVYMVSRLADERLRDALLASYPELAAEEPAIVQRVEYWCRHADAIVIGFTLDGVPRWDAPVGNMVCIDVARWRPKASYSDADGLSAAVRILHAPNHRAFKGTDDLVAAVGRLKGEGLLVELDLIERSPNEEVREAMQRADVLADQFIAPGYGLAAIEGMASGLPVLCNLDDQTATPLFDSRSFLGECPIVSTPPERLDHNLRRLIGDPGLRRDLGTAGRRYVEKYHSYAAAQHLFAAVHERLRGADVDLLEVFHPDRSTFNRQTPRVAHPLVNHRLP